MGTLLLALMLAAYALAMTLGRGSFGPLNMALLLAAVVGVGLFAFVEMRVGAPLIRMADRLGAPRMTVIGLTGMAGGSIILAMMSVAFGIPGYIAPIVVVTVSYALFQTANNTAVMTDIRPDQRGVIAGLLSLSRNLGLITGASAMGAVFTFAVAAVLILVTQAVALGSRVLARRHLRLA